jgi:pyridoxal phosphate enzyme (YggS family)
MQGKVSKNLSEIEKELAGTGARLLPVSKTFPPVRIQEAYDAGYRDFGENRVQEILEKRPQLPGDIRWHLIGQLQTNKVKQIAGFIHLIQSVDSEKLLAEIQKQAFRHSRRIPVLLQVHIAEEESKSGWDAGELQRWVEEGGPGRFPDVEFRGLMGMATFTDDKEKIRMEFRLLANLKAMLSSVKQFPNFRMEELSMGMSGDYQIAAEEGSSMVRMGSAIFGDR